LQGTTKSLIVIGGGAAGIFCAVNAARKDPSLQVTVLEKTGKLLSKVRISGGGRCNVTHACYEIGDMAKRYPRGGQFVRKAFHRWFTTDTIGWFRERGVELKTEEDGRMFPVSDSSQTIIDCLMKEVNLRGVEIRMRAEVAALERGDRDGAGGDSGAGGAGGAGFRVRLADGRLLFADFICIACGGYPKSTMFEWIERLGHTIEPPVPSLFTFNMPGNSITKLMGVSLPAVQVKIAGSRLLEKGPMLITHWGLSGPVVLRLSAWGARELAGRDYRFQILVNWLPETTEILARLRLQELRYDWAAQKVSTKNPFDLPQRLWEWLLASAGIGSEVRWADLPARDQNKLVSQLCAGEFAVQGKTTFKEEFVTAGGVRLSQVDPNTMQSRLVPGLYFAGEILDVDGITGGFNFQHAWTSGFIAAASLAGPAGFGGTGGLGGPGGSGEPGVPGGTGSVSKGRSA
jgi:predicted Rossmann fold flavoprotein